MTEDSTPASRATHGEGERCVVREDGTADAESVAAPAHPQAGTGRANAQTANPRTTNARTNDPEALAGHVRRPPARPDVDPEDWAATPGSDDDRYVRERPPHW